MRTYQLKPDQRSALGGITHLFVVTKEDLAGPTAAKQIPLMESTNGDIGWPRAFVQVHRPIVGPTILYTLSLGTTAAPTAIMSPASVITMNVGSNFFPTEANAPTAVIGTLVLAIGAGTSNNAPITDGELWVGLTLTRRVDLLAIQP